jgi:glycosyltransferase involved in cell wall biosynthesis
MVEEGERDRLRPIILVLTDHYVPGFRHGGPIRSIRSLVRSLGEEFDFRILTRDRDAGSSKPFAIRRPGEWQHVDEGLVRYLSPRELALDLWRLLRSTPHDVLYLNSYFSPMFTIFPMILRLLRVLPRKPVVIAPRGEFSPGALGIKTLKKRIWKGLADGLGLYRDATWQATNPEEVTQIEAVVGDHARVYLGPVLPDPGSIVDDQGIEGATLPKVSGSARFVFFSRITPMKNLAFAVTILCRETVGRVSLDVYGIVDDERYWARCRHLIASCGNPNVVITYRGELPHEQVAPTLARYDLLLLPSRGENFGHVIFEALASGCPVAISDRTPWSRVQDEGAGWVIPLSDESRWKEIMGRVVDADEEVLRQLREAALRVALSQSHRERDIEMNRQLFAMAVVSGRTGIQAAE